LQCSHVREICEKLATTNHIGDHEWRVLCLRSCRNPWPVTEEGKRQRKSIRGIDSNSQVLPLVVRRAPSMNCYVIRGNANATSWRVVGCEWIEVRRGVTAIYVGTWTRGKGGVEFIGFEEMRWCATTCCRSWLQYIMRSFIPIPYEKLCELRRLKNSHSLLIISPWVRWERRLWRRRGLVAV